MKQYFRITYYFSVILIFIVVALLGYTQTAAFRDFLRSYILEHSSDIVNGSIAFNTLEGNLFTGLVFTDVTFYENGQAVITAEKVEVKYDPVAFFFKRVSIIDATIWNAHINLQRSVNGSWNIDRLFRSSSHDTTPSPWVIDIKNVRLLDSRISLVDSLTLSQRTTSISDSVVDYAVVAVDSCNLETSLTFSYHYYEATIRSFSFRLRQPDFKLHQLRGSFLLSKDHLIARDVFIRTNRSKLQITASLEDTDLFSHIRLEQLYDKPVALKLKAQPLHMSDLKMFLYPYVDFLDTTATITISTTGNFSNLTVSECSIESGNTELHLQGTIHNLHTPRDLELHITSTRSLIDPSLRTGLLRGLNLPNLDFLGQITTVLSFDGKPEHFQAKVSTRSSVGIVEANATMSFQTKPHTYEGSIRVLRGNISKIFSDGSVTSNLNGFITFNGAGYDYRTMTAVMKIQFDTSEVNALPLSQMVTVVNTSDGYLNLHSVAQLGSGRYELSGQAHFSETSDSYSYQGRILSCNLAELLQNKKYESLLSFHFSGGGSRRSTEHRDSLSINFYPSTFGEHPLEIATLKIGYSGDDNNHQQLKVISDPLQLTLSGSFTLSSAVKSFQTAVLSFGSYFTENLFLFHSKDQSPTSSYTRYGVKTAETDISFTANCTDLSVLGAIFSLPMEGVIQTEGTLKQKNDGIIFSAALKSDECAIDYSDGVLVAERFNASVTTADYSNSKHKVDFQTSINLKSDRIRINETSLTDITTRFTAKDDTGTFNVESIVDATVQVTLESNWEKRDTCIVVQLPMIKLTFDSLFTIHNTSASYGRILKEGYNIDFLVLSQDSFNVSLKGLVNPFQTSALKVVVRNFDCDNLQYFLPVASRTGVAGAIKGILNADVEFHGSLENPVFDIKAELTNAVIKEAKIETVKGELFYSQQQVQINGSVTLANRTEPAVILQGTIPYGIYLSASTPRVPLTSNVDVLIKANNVDATLLSPFLPFLSDLKGAIQCNLRMVGPVNAPFYEGTVDLSNVEFLFNPLGIRYILNGSAVSEEDRIRLKNVTLKNVPEDKRPNSLLNIDGTLSLYGLTLTRFSLKSRGELLIMKENQRLAGQKLYGNLYVATSSQGLLWEGSPERSYLRGDIFLVDAQLIFPPERELAAVRTGSIAVTFKDDTSLTPQITEQQKKRKLLSSETGTSVNIQESNSFLDNIEYDLGIETYGSTTIRFVFNTQTSEELFAVLQGRLTYSKSAGIDRFVGQVEVADRSYYNFFKKFDASGKISFTGDLLNPELNVTARYEGIRIKDTTTYTQSSFSSDRERIAVILDITGTRNEPKVKIRIERFENTEWVKYETGDDESNAISFIISGQFTEELTTQQRASMIGTNVGFGLATGMITGPLSEALRRNTAGYIQSLDVLYYGGQFEKSTDVRLTGQVGDAVFRFGGKVINDPFGNANVSVEVPLSMFSRNLIFSLEHKVEGTEFAQEQRRAYNTARIFYRFSF